MTLQIYGYGVLITLVLTISLMIIFNDEIENMLGNSTSDEFLSAIIFSIVAIVLAWPLVIPIAIISIIGIKLKKRYYDE